MHPEYLVCSFAYLALWDHPDLAGPHCVSLCRLSICQDSTWGEEFQFMMNEEHRSSHNFKTVPGSKESVEIDLSQL